MGKSLRSKRMRKNRIVKRTHYGPKEAEKLKAALAFEYNEETEKVHLSMFHDIMNGPPPKVPGLEPGSKLERAHLTEGHVSVDRIDNFNVGRMQRISSSAVRALTKGAQRTDIYHPHDKKVEESKETDKTEDKMDEAEPRIYDKKTLKDQYGQYPVWMNRKKVMKQARAHRLEKAKAKKVERRRGGRKIKVTDVEMKDNSGGSSDESDMDL